MDYNVNVKLELHKRSKSTSATGTSGKKSSNTSAGHEIRRKTNSSLRGEDLPTGGVGKASGAIGFLVGATVIKRSIASVANTTVNIAGMITNNRYRQQRDKDTIRLVTNPVGMGIDALKYGIKKHFEVTRENQRIDYNIRRSGNSIPTRSGTGGVTL